MRKTIAAAALSLSAITTNHLNGADFGTWTNWSVDYAATDKIELAAGMEYRTTDNASETDRWAFNGGITYNPLKHLSVEGVYEFHHRNRSGVWKNRHRYNLAAIGSLKAGRWNFSLRERFQHTIESGESELRLRSRLQAKFKATNKISPYASIEMYNSLHSGEKFDITRMRYRAGFDFKIADNVSTDIYYLFNAEDGANKNIAGLDIAFHF